MRETHTTSDWTAGTPIRPNIRALEIAQDRVEEKLFASRLGGKTAPFEIVGERQDASAAFERVGFPAILKTIRMGYDGKGQARVGEPRDISEAWAPFCEVPVAKPLVHFAVPIVGIVFFGDEFHGIAQGHFGEALTRLSAFRMKRLYCSLPQPVLLIPIDRCMLKNYIVQQEVFA